MMRTEEELFDIRVTDRILDNHSRIGITGRVPASTSLLESNQSFMNSLRHDNIGELDVELVKNFANRRNLLIFDLLEVTLSDTITNDHHMFGI